MLIIWRPLIETNGSRGGWTHVDSLMIVFQFLSAIVDFRHKTELCSAKQTVELSQSCLVLFQQPPNVPARRTVGQIGQKCKETLNFTRSIQL